MALNALAGLTGGYTLQPGVAASITGGRPVLAPGLLARLLRGHTGLALESKLMALFSLCAHAHQRAARLAISAAQPPHAPALPALPARLLTLETARDHLRSIALDWPGQLALLARPSLEFIEQKQASAQADIALTAIQIDAMAWLKTCPLKLAPGDVCATDAQARTALQALRTWLETLVLQQPLEDWLTQHRAPEALAHWCAQRSADLPPARFLAACHPVGSRLAPPLTPLALLDPDAPMQTAQLTALAQSIARHADFAQMPTWRGQCHETGAWTRLRHQTPAAGQARQVLTTAWARLAARWLELVELAAAGTAPATDEPKKRCANAYAMGALASGALPLGAGQAIAWVEMARGLLLHWVQLDEQGQVADYRVVAPTEWNFHRDGALAQALRALPPDDHASAWLLGTAYDACVACQVAPSAQ